MPGISSLLSNCSKICSLSNEEIRNLRGGKFVAAITFGTFSGTVSTLIRAPLYIAFETVRAVFCCLGMIFTGCGFTGCSRFLAIAFTASVGRMALFSTLKLPYEIFRGFVPIAGYYVTAKAIDPLLKCCTREEEATAGESVESAPSTTSEPQGPIALIDSAKFSPEE